MKWFSADSNSVPASHPSMMHWVVVFVIVHLISRTVSSYEFNEITFSTTLSNAVSQIVNDFYTQKSSTLSITKSAFYLENYEKQIGVINEILYRTSSKIVVVIEDCSFLSETMHRFYNLIFIDSYEAFMQIFEMIRNDSLFDYTGYYTIVLTESRRDQYIVISKVLNDCWSVYITNVVIVTPMGSRLDSSSAIYTYFPYTVYHCEIVAPVILNYYFINSTFLYNIDHFPDKLKNMYRCPLTLVTHNVTPFMILYRNQNGDGYRTDGIDGITFRVLSQQLNFTPIIEVPNEANGSSIFMEMVMTGSANLTIGGFSFTIKRAELMSASSPYLYSSLLYAVPKGKAYTALEKLFLPFKLQIWILMGMLLFFALITTTFLPDKKLKFLASERNRTPFLNTVSVLFGGAVTSLPRRNFARTVLIIWIFGCIVLRSAFQGSLFEYIQKPRNLPSASTLPDLIARNYTLYMSTAIFQLFRNTSKFHKNIRIHNFGTDERYDILLDSNFNGAVLTTDVGISYYNMKHFKTTGVVSSTKDRMFLLPFCIFFRKHSCLNEPITTLINKYTNSGLLEYWTGQYFQKRFVNVKHEQLEDQQPQRLTIRQLLGTFIISSILLVAAFVVFFFEVISTRFVFLEKLFTLLL